MNDPVKLTTAWKERFYTTPLGCNVQKRATLNRKTGCVDEEYVLSCPPEIADALRGREFDRRGR